MCDGAERQSSPPVLAPASSCLLLRPLPEPLQPVIEVAPPTPFIPVSFSQQHQQHQQRVPSSLAAPRAVRPIDSRTLSSMHHPTARPPFLPRLFLPVGPPPPEKQPPLCYFHHARTTGDAYCDDFGREEQRVRGYTVDGYRKPEGYQARRTDGTTLDSRGAATQGWRGHALPSNHATGADSKWSNHGNHPPAANKGGGNRGDQHLLVSVSLNFGGHHSHQPRGDGANEAASVPSPSRRATDDSDDDGTDDHLEAQRQRTHWGHHRNSSVASGQSVGEGARNKRQHSRGDVGTANGLGGGHAPQGGMNNGSAHTYGDEGAARAREREATKKRERDADRHGQASTNGEQARKARRLRSDQSAARKDEVRKRATREQIGILERVFEQEPLPGRAAHQALANELGSSPRRVRVWFQNRRARARQKEGKRFIIVNYAAGSPTDAESLSKENAEQRI